ncbi:putative general amino acid permease [Xylariomycetidae sp. FL2044]|nr:putative general amino acid permease [Xylariomycetidae sp. FL2044]
MSASKYTEKGPPVVSEPVPSEAGEHIGTVTDVKPGSQALHRKLRGPEVQLFAIGGAIGTSLYVQMGSALPKGGPAGLFLGFLVWGGVMLCVNECFAEMVTWAPVPSPFIRFGEWVDGALSFAMAWNFFLNMAFLVPFEIVALQIMFTFWTDKLPVEAVVCVVIVLYALLNVISVRWFGIAEFYASIFKVFLIIGLFAFTFITMVGGNPQHNAYGFTYWQNPGAFVEHLQPGALGRFLGVLSCIIQASFSICGPEYVSMVAAESENPRKILPKAYRSFVWRILVFFVGSALCMGIVIPYDDATLNAILGGEEDGSGTGAASPYIIAMKRMGITGLPHLVNALIITSVFSAGNGLLFSATRTLHGMSLKGYAPPFLSRCTKAGVPIWSLCVALSFCLLAFLQVSNSSADVLNWLVYLVTCCQLINYCSTSVIYLHFHSALKKQGISRDTLPYKGRFQPYAAYVAICGTSIMALLLGYDLFIWGGWDLMFFFLDYAMIGFFIVLFVGWKLVFRTKYVRPGTADLSLGGLKEEIDAYEELYVPRESGYVGKVADKIFG